MAVNSSPTPEMLAFPFDGDRRALDFVGTVGDRAHRALERLRAPEDLGRWIVEAELADRAHAADARDLRVAYGQRERRPAFTTRLAHMGQASPREPYPP
jgi:hypothetical protein